VNGATVDDHGVEPWIWSQQYLDLTYLNKKEGLTGWGFKLVIGGNAIDGHGGLYPIYNWYLVNQNASPLSYDTWYRLEYQVHFTSANHIQVHPRVYNAAGALLYQDADFIQSDPGGNCLVTPPDRNCYGGYSDWTLATWYSRANPVTGIPTYGDFQVNRQPDPLQAGTTLQTLVMGNNGAQYANNTGLFWYYAAVKICADTWCGP
jgi:hypothetical protein